MTLQDLLIANRNNQSLVADLLDVSRKTVFEVLKHDKPNRIIEDEQNGGYILLTPTRTKK